MRDVTPWKGGSRAGRRQAIQLPAGQRVLGAVFHNIIADRRPLGVLPGAHGLEWSIDDEGEPDRSYPLRQAQLRVEELATANRRKDEFLAMVGHELRNPLASINNGIRLLSHQAQDTPARQKTQAMIERQVRRMTQLVQDLQDVSRITHGRLNVQRERIDLRDVVRNAIETVESDIQQRSHRLTIALPDAPLWLQGDPGRLEQVFINLLANASRYTDVGGEVSVRVQARNGQAIVSIRDSGIGIAREVLPHLFDLFKQADEAAPRSASGLGIGLALVRDLVESHGGSVTGESAGLGRGSEFTVRLPRELDVIDGVTNTAFR